VPAYVVLDIEVTDPAAYAEYRELDTPTVAAHGGRFLVRGGAVHPLEGEWSPERLVIIEFESVARARAWYDSAEYARARAVRQRASRGRVLIVEGAAGAA